MHATDHTTLAQFLIEEFRHDNAGQTDLTGLILDVAKACKSIAHLLGKGHLAGVHGVTGDINPQGENQALMDILSHKAIVDAVSQTGHVAAVVSEESEHIIPVSHERGRGRLLLCIDPLDGSSNIDINGTTGTIFSILPFGAPDQRPATEEDFFVPGRDHLAAGYALYGSSTMFVITVGTGVYGFTLDPDVGDFVLTHPRLRVPPTTSFFAINAANSRFWEGPVRQYVDELLAGKAGKRGKDYNMRWPAAVIADCHRILIKGGIYLYPRDSKNPDMSGRLRLLYEGTPIAMLMTQAGGRCLTGTEDVMDIVPRSLHQRVPLVFGSLEEADRVATLYAQESPPRAMPLFNPRSLFRL